MNLARFAKLPTEQQNPRSFRLDRLSAFQIASLMNAEDRRILQAIRARRNAIGKAVERIAAAFAHGGRLFFIGAGTSGRLGIIEAAECPPTFGTPPGLVQAVMAGGKAAVFRSKEGAEDSRAEARRQVRKRVRAGDVVVGIAASGITPFVQEGLKSARARRAGTILVTCNRQAVSRLADIVIALDTGPEVLTGSTRLKAGSACKMVLNMLTTGAMVRRGKVYRHWMVDVQPKSKKLVARGLRLIERLGNVSARDAQRFFRSARGRVKVAIVMARLGVDGQEAARRIERAGGFLGKVL